MPVGPFDARTKRSRCIACSASHLKCSGDVPCENCSRRRIACSFAARDPTKRLILVERGKQKTVANWSLTATSSSSSSSSSSCSSPFPLTVRNSKPTISRLPQNPIDEISRYLSFFDLFAKTNSFTGRGRTTGDEVKQLAELHSRRGSHVRHAMIAVGGMFAGRRNLVDATARRETGLVALQHYLYSVTGLREAIDELEILSRTLQREKVQDQLVCILWTTLLLGLFELMNDRTGHGWQRHIIHGTCMALQASGPSSCRSGPGFAFFTQARIFEISRTILYNERTFLSEPGWVALSRELSNNGEYIWSPLDSLLDIMVMCSDLRVRAADLTQKFLLSPVLNLTEEATAISDAGFKLKEALQTWRSAYLSPETQAPSAHQDNDLFPSSSQTLYRNRLRPPLPDPSTLLSRIFHASICIYLSGTFDYDIPQWQTLGLQIPTLHQKTILRHVHDILALTSIGLDTTSLSGVLFLFPLRIAGARASGRGPSGEVLREAVRALVARIGTDFAVAGAVESDLVSLWEIRALEVRE
ncbi:hypothetical protein E4U21_003052 [Claviceps maximensis]|nr:hypothetical protein E4U21_003052 [Claviceps maximensis]